MDSDCRREGRLNHQRRGLLGIGTTSEDDSAGIKERLCSCKMANWNAGMTWDSWKRLMGRIRGPEVSPKHLPSRGDAGRYMLPLWGSPFQCLVNFKK